MNKPVIIIDPYTLFKYGSYVIFFHLTLNFQGKTKDNFHIVSIRISTFF